MIPPRWRKVLRDLTINKTRTMLVVLSIAVGVFAVGSVSGARVILSRDLAAIYATSHDASAVINATKIDESFVKSIREMNEVEDADGRTTFVMRVRLADGRKSNLIFHTISDFDAVSVNRFAYETGERIPPRRELILERSSLALFDKRVGDTLTVEVEEGKTREIKIAGTVYDITAPPVQFANFGTAYITQDTLAWLGRARGFGSMRIVVSEGKKDRAHIQSVVDKIKERVEDNGGVYFGANIQQNPGEHLANEQIQTMLLILVALGGLALFLSAFLVVNTITAVMQQHIKQIGIMKTFGGGVGQLTTMYVALVLLFGALSLLVAVPLGTLGAQGLAGFVAGLLNFEILTRGVPTEVLLIELAVGMIVPTAASLAPILNGARMTIREALVSTGLTIANTQPRESAEQTRKGFGGLPNFVSRPMKLSLRNTFRRKGRLALTLGTLVLASAIFISVFSVRDSLNQTLEDSLRYWSYDIEIFLKRAHGEDKVLREMRNVAGVVHAETWSTSGGRRLRDDKSEGRFIGIIAPPAQTQLLKPILLQGRWLLPEDENAVVLNQDVIDDEPDVKLGDTITLKIGSRNFRFSVVGVAQSTLTGQVRNPRTAYVNQNGLRKVITLGRQVNNVVVVTERHDAESRLRFAREIEEHFRAVDMPVDTYETMSERREQIAFQFNILITFLLIMAVLLAVVGALGLTGTMSMNVLERTREIGVMRAIGASNRAIRRIVIVEGVLIGLLSWLIGAILALPISYVLSNAVGMAFLRRPLNFEFSWGGIGLWLAVVVVLAGLASFVPAWRASRLTVREVLAYE
jgi:putative ABC transport system permease protein